MVDGRLNPRMMFSAAIFPRVISLLHHTVEKNINKWSCTMYNRRIPRALPRVWRRNLYFSILMWTTKYIYYYIACMNLEDELLLRMHAHDQPELIERDKWMTWRKEIQDNSLVRFVLIAKDKWMTWARRFKIISLVGFIFIVYIDTPSVPKYNTFWLFSDKIRESAIDACTPHLPS
jgi:hypothetical protein